jgi:hypothetical protein
MELLGLDISENIYANLYGYDYVINKAETHIYYVDGWYEIQYDIEGGPYFMFEGHTNWFDIEEV